MIKLSGVIITLNEEKNILRCIRSLKEVCDEIVVVDSGSTDNTKAICEQEGALFFTREFRGFSEQKNAALNKATYNYVLSLDADEYLSTELTESILKIKNNCKADAYEMNRLSSYKGKWIKTSGWYPDTKLRLWKKDIGRWDGGAIHEKVSVDKNIKIAHLKGDILHNAYNSINEMQRKNMHYSELYALENRFKVASSLLQILVKPPFTFFKSYILQRGFTQGFEGLLIAGAQSEWTFFKYSKLYQANNRLSTSLIISTYNRANALELVLLSLMKQSEMPDEVIIADDGSTEETAELIEKYRTKLIIPLLHCWHADEGFKLGEIRNKAIALAQGEYIIQIDGDIVMHKHFIRAHKRMARIGCFVQGSRALLSNEVTNEAVDRKITNFRAFTKGITNRFNALYLPLISRLITRPTKKLEGIRGCNMGFWKSDLLLVNGFNEDIQGWGREDSELVARLFNNNVFRKNIKLSGFGYHLYHKEHSRNSLQRNDEILTEAIEKNRKRCANGIDKYLQVGGNLSEIE